MAAQRTVRHDDAFEAVLRQLCSSANDNILIHQIGGQAQLLEMAARTGIYTARDLRDVERAQRWLGRRR